jgi:hypothetical protein
MAGLCTLLSGRIFDRREAEFERADGEIRTPGQRFTKPLLYH